MNCFRVFIHPDIIVKDLKVFCVQEWTKISLYQSPTFLDITGRCYVMLLSLEQTSQNNDCKSVDELLYKVSSQCTLEFTLIYLYLIFFSGWRFFYSNAHRGIMIHFFHKQF